MSFTSENTMGLSSWFALRNDRVEMHLSLQQCEGVLTNQDRSTSQFSLKVSKNKGMKKQSSQQTASITLNSVNETLFNAVNNTRPVGKALYNLFLGFVYTGCCSR